MLLLNYKCKIKKEHNILEYKKSIIIRRQKAEKWDEIFLIKIIIDNQL